MKSIMKCKKEIVFMNIIQKNKKIYNKGKKELGEDSEKYVEMYKDALIKNNQKKRQIALEHANKYFIIFIESYNKISDRLEQDKQKLEDLIEEEILRRKKIDGFLHEKLGIRTENPIKYIEVFTSIDRNIEETLKQRRIDDHRWT